MDTSIVRLGLIGAGKWGQNYIRTLKMLKTAKLIKIASRHNEASKFIDDECKITSNWKDVASSRELDGIIIATPPSSHLKIAKFAIEHGKNLIIEKPLSLNFEEAKEFLMFAKGKNLQIKVNHIHLYHPAFRVIKSISKIYKIKSIYSKGGSNGPFRSDIRALWDWGVHDIAMCLDLINMIPIVKDANYLKKEEGINFNKELVRLKLSFNNNINATIETGNLMQIKTRILKVNYGKFNLIYDSQSSNPLNLDECYNSYFKNNFKELFNLRKETPLYILLDEFIKGIKVSSKDKSDLNLAINTLKILEEVTNKLI